MRVVTVRVTVSALRTFFIVLIDAQFNNYTQTINTIIMKPKETQILGLLITILLALIVLDLYTIYSITSYIKLTSLDVITSFAVVDAIFYQVIKLIIISYGIFALSVEIRGIYVLRDRLKNKILAKLRQDGLIKQLEQDKPIVPEFHNVGTIKGSADNPYTLQDLLNEAQSQEKASDLNFEPTDDLHQVKYFKDRYGYKAYNSLSVHDQGLLIRGSQNLKNKVLRVLQQYYLNIERVTELTPRESECYKNISEDRTDYLNTK